MTKTKENQAGERTLKNYSGKKYSEEQVAWTKEYAGNVFDQAQCKDFQRWSGTDCKTISEILELEDGEHILAEFYDPAFTVEGRQS